MPQVSRLQVRGYLFAVGAVALALLLTELSGLPEERNPYLISFAAVALTAWYGGLGPAALSIILASLGINLLFVSPTGAPGLNWINLLELAVFALVALVISSLNESRRRAEAGLQQLYEAEQRARRLAEGAAGRAAHLQSVTAALSEAATPVEVAGVIVNESLAALGGRSGVIVLCNPDRTGYELVSAAGEPVEIEMVSRSLSADGPTRLSEAIRSGKYVWIESVAAAAENDPALATFRDRIGDGTIIAYPLVAEGAPVGALCLTIAEPRQFNQDDSDLLAALAGLYVQALERARLYEAERLARRAAEKAEQRFAFLAKASDVLAAALGYEETIQAVADLAVPAIADWCVVDLVADDLSNRPFAVAHIDRTMRALAIEMQRRYPPDPNRLPGFARVFRDGEPRLVSEVSEADLEKMITDAEHLEMIRRLAPTSYMMVPLLARGRLLGIISLAATTSGRRYAKSDLMLAEELAHRAALAVDNARLYQEAQESIRSREVFITVASHELKTPMTVLRGYVDLLQRYGTNQTLTPEQLQRTLGALSSQVSRLDNLMDILWDLSRIQIGRLSLSFEPVDLCALTARLVEEIRPELERHTIELSYPETPLVVEGDVPRLEQIIRNLLHNAIKYSPEGGPVNVFLESEGTYAALAVSDRGLGIPAEAIPHLFERFFRVKAATGRPTEGLGVGLYVVRELVTLHGGSVEVESTEGEGSTFTVRLPLARPGPKPAG